MSFSNSPAVIEGKCAYALALLACVAATLLALPLAVHVDPTNIAMLFLLVVVLVAARFGSGPAVLAAFASVALFDFFFVPPRFTFVVAESRYLVIFAVMLAVALLTGQLAARLRDKAELAARREAEARALYEMARELSGAYAIEQVAESAARFLKSQLEVRAILYVLRGDHEVQVLPAAHGASGCQSHVRRVLEGGQPLWLAAEESGFAPALALPLVSPVRTRGVLLASAADGTTPLGDTQRPLLEAVASLVAIAVERLHYSEVAHEVEIQMASERLRNALLAAVSHDLRTPLTVLVGQADALTLDEAKLPAPARDAVAAIRDQALRLSAQVHKLLDMARLQTGRIVLNREWQPLEEVIGSSLRAMQAVLAGRELKLELAADLPPLEIDAVLLERVLCNLLENAARCAPVGAIVIAARLKDEKLVVEVADSGPGVPAGEEARIFDRFVRGEQKTPTGGVGLGLAICRAIIAAHGGEIMAENRPGGGLVVRFTLPRGNPPRIDEDDGD